MDIEEHYGRIASVIEKADSILITAGAGMGVDSGLPDFRGDKGFWQAYPALADENLSFQDLANPAWFDYDPSRAWGFYGHRFLLYKKTLPHSGFEILKKWCDSKVIPSFIFTSNVDGHFQKSGLSSEQILECHGSINHLQCTGHCSLIWQLDDLDIKICNETLRAEGDFPKCPECGAIARPNILMFYDHHWIATRTNTQQKHFDLWRKKVSKKEVVIIELGAGKAIPSVRNLSESMKGTLIRINPRDFDGPPHILSIEGNAADVLAAIDLYM